MSNVLALIETAHDGSIRPTAATIIAAASRLGDAVAVVTRPGLAGQLGSLGASRVHTIIVHGEQSTLSIPEVEALAAAAAEFMPSAIVIGNTVEGRDVAGRLAARLGAALAIDAVDVKLHGDKPVATHSIFGGAYTVESSATAGPLIVTVRQGSVEQEAAATENETTGTATVA